MKLSIDLSRVPGISKSKCGRCSTSDVHSSLVTYQLGSVLLVATGGGVIFKQEFGSDLGINGIHSDPTDKRDLCICGSRGSLVLMHFSDTTCKKYNPLPLSPTLTPELRTDQEYMTLSFVILLSGCAGTLALSCDIIDDIGDPLISPLLQPIGPELYT